MGDLKYEERQTPKDDKKIRALKREIKTAEEWNRAFDDDSATRDAKRVRSGKKAQIVRLKEVEKFEDVTVAYKIVTGTDDIATADKVNDKEWKKWRDDAVAVLEAEIESIDNF